MIKTVYDPPTVNTEAPASVERFWTGISQSQPVGSVSAAADFLKMLGKAWNNSDTTPQFYASCRRPEFQPEAGLAHMLPVQRKMMSQNSIHGQAMMRTGLAVYAHVQPLS